MNRRFGNGDTGHTSSVKNRRFLTASPQGEAFGPLSQLRCPAPSSEGAKGGCLKPASSEGAEGGQVSIQENMTPISLRGDWAACQKSFAEFAASAANPLKSIFRRGVYLAEKTSQAASVEFVRQWRTNYARGRLQKSVGKARRGFSTVENLL